MITAGPLTGRYQRGRLLGQGAMSDVFEATDQVTGGTVALKVVRSDDPELARRLAQEAKVLGRVEHPGLVRLLDTGMIDGHPFLVMALIEGPTLAEVLRHGPLAPALTAEVGAALAEALAAVHREGIVHRDVKPSNILLEGGVTARLGDFGIARILDTATLTLTGSTLGTAAYMAPEQLEDHQVGPSADVWSLGIVLLECLTGRRVYAGTTAEIIGRRAGHDVPLPPELPVPWTLMIAAMVDHRPDQRLTSEEAASLLSSPALRTPWDPSAAPTEPVMPIAPLDPTELAAATVVRPAPSPSPSPSPGAAGPRRAAWRPKRKLAFFVALGAMLLAVLIGVELAGSNGLATLPPRHTHVVSTVKKSTATTTTLASPSAALAVLVRDVAADEQSHALSAHDAAAMDDKAEQAVTEASAGKLPQASSDLQAVATEIGRVEEDDALTAPAATTLQADLTTLATALGLSAASVQPQSSDTTPTTPAGGPAGTPPAKGPGHGAHGGPRH